MSELSLKQRILRYLRNHPEWIHGEDIAKMAQQAGYEAESGRRRLRDLLTEGVVETEPRPGKRTTSNWYRAKQFINVNLSSVRANEVFEKI